MLISVVVPVYKSVDTLLILTRKLISLLIMRKKNLILFFMIPLKKFLLTFIFF